MPHHPAEPVSDKQIRERIASVAHWYHQIEIRPGITTPGINNSAHTLRQLDLAARYDGLRVLDIGARDGYFSFELERRGAEVVAVDYMDPAETGFPVARELLGSSVDFHVGNIYDLTPERHGTFDLVLFLGLLYHLRDPLLALDRIWDVCNPDAVLMLETQLLDNALLVGDGRFRTLADDRSRADATCASCSSIRRTRSTAITPTTGPRTRPARAGCCAPRASRSPARTSTARAGSSMRARWSTTPRSTTGAWRRRPSRRRAAARRPLSPTSR